MPLPACRHAAGTISSPSVEGVWRMVSEDSDQVLPGLAPVHGFGDARDLDESFGRQMSAGLNESDAMSELLEVALLGREHWVPFEERDDRVQQIASTPHN